MTWRTNEPDMGDVQPRPMYERYGLIPSACPRCGSADHPIWWSFLTLTDGVWSAKCFVCLKFTFFVRAVK